MNQLLEYIRRAQEDKVPYAATLQKCLNWGVPRPKAETLADEGSNFSYGEAFLKERQTPGYFRDESHFRGGVTISAEWYVIGQLRREKRAPAELPLNLAQPESTSTVEGEESPLAICYARLTDVQRYILGEVDEGKSQQEIGLMLHEKYPETFRIEQSEKKPSLNALGLRVFRLLQKAKQQLEDCLKEHGIFLRRRKRKQPFPA